MNISYIYLLIDEIDHITILWREQDKPLDRVNGIKKIQYCADAFPCVAAALSDISTRTAFLENTSDDELHDILVRTRTALISSIE